MHARKTGLNADKFATFWMFPKRFYHSFVLQMTPIHSRSRVNLFTIQINLFKYKKFKDGGCAYKNTGSGHLKGAVSRQSSSFCLILQITRPQPLWNFK